MMNHEKILQSKENVQECIAILEEKRSIFEFKNQYDKAEKTDKKIESLRNVLEKKKGTSLKTKQKNETYINKESYTSKYKEFTKSWKTRIKRHQSQTEILIQNMKLNHQIEIKNFKSQCMKESKKDLKRIIKFSHKVLNEIFIRDTLSKQKRYAEAQICHNEIEKMQALERAVHEEKILHEFNLKQQNKKNQQKKEIELLETKRKYGLQSLIKTRENKLIALKKHYKNRALDLELQQINENIKYKKGNKNYRVVQSKKKGKKKKKKNELKEITNKLFEELNGIPIMDVDSPKQRSKPLGFGSRETRFVGDSTLFCEIEDYNQLKRAKILIEDSKALASELDEVFDYITKNNF